MYRDEVVSMQIWKEEQLELHKRIDDSKRCLSANTHTNAR